MTMPLPAAVDTAPALAPASLPAVIDMEASGFGQGSYPIEVGYVLPDASSFCTLIRPQPDWTYWDDAAERVHGISRLGAQCHGRSVASVAQLLNQHLAGMTVYCDGWAHDYTWLHILFEAADERPRFRLEHVLRLISPAELPHWPAAKQAAAEELGLQRHRASNDARMLQRALTHVHALESVRAAG